jgi:serine/threonine protein kinase/tetratricopeptide (TPR) repeat protein
VNAAPHPVDPLVEGEPGCDPELADILEAYLTALERGESPDRDAFLAGHPRHAVELARYLPWVELLYEAKPRGDAAANPPMPARLGDFRIVGELGRGGMGIVYEAEQISLKRRVALKVLPFASMLDERQLARFKNEALAAAQLHHPNIVPVFAVGCEQGLHFYVMQLIEGATLEQLIHESAAPGDSPAGDSTVRLAAAKTDAGTVGVAARLRRFAEWIAQAAEALDHAHQQGIVHRDVKPSNLMIGKAGDLWVTDFGLARTQLDASVTASGELLGTLRYMSPEQLRTRPGFVDHRGDIYSLGLTLYELVAGRPAFEGAMQQELIRRIENDEPPSLVRLDPRVPRDLDSIVSKAIAKAPEARYASAQEMADDLRAFLEGRPTVARPPTWRDSCEKWVRRHARLAASVGLVLALVGICAVVGAVLVWRARGETERALELASANHQRAEAHLEDSRRAVDELFTGVATELSDVPGAENVRQGLLNQALAYYQKFAEQTASNPTVRAEQAAAHYRCGQIREQLGDDDGAVADYRNARRLWRALRTAGDGDPLRSLALCENNIGLIHFRAGRSEQAENHLRAALELQRQLTSRRPDDVEATRDLALGSANLGMVLAAMGRRDEARECLEQALEMRSRDPSPLPAARGDLAATYNQLGYLLSTSSLAEAEAAYRRAAAAFELLAKDQPRTLRWQAELAATLNNLAAVAAQAGRLEEAEADYRRAVGILRTLAERAPRVVAFARDLAVSQNNLGYLLSRRDRHAEAIGEFEAARDNLLRLAREHDRSPEFASRLGAVCNNLGLALESQDHRAQAQAAYDEAIAWQQRALALSPDWRLAQSYLDAHTANLQRIRAATGQPDAVGEPAAPSLQSTGPIESNDPLPSKQ